MASFKYSNVYINDNYLIGGPYEKKSNLKNLNAYIDNFYNNEKTIEKCEVSLQKEVINNLLTKNKLNSKSIDLVIGGDLTNQLSATTYNIRNYDIPFLGVYGACSTYVEALIILSNLINFAQINTGICITSSHNLNSEKQFRFPVEYGSPKPERTTFTATGAVGSIVSNKKSNIKIINSTIGKVIDKSIKDSFNLGAAMAPAAAKVINDHFKELSIKNDFYDLILTGDLGIGGLKLLNILLEKEYNLKIKKIMDSGCLLYKKGQETYDGASGPIVLPLVLFGKIIKEKKYKKILIIGTGAMHSPVMVNQKDSIPSIAYAIGLEVL